MSGKPKTNEKFLSELYSLVGDEYTPLEPYKMTHTPILMKHNVCGHTFNVRPHNFFTAGSRCPKCYGSIKLSNDQFLERFSKYGDKTIIPLEEYKTNSRSILCECSICHNQWKASPTNLVKGTGCPKCQSVRSGIRQRMTNEEFLKRLRNEHGDLIEALEPYVVSNIKISFKCNTCGYVWKTTPDHILRGCGCPCCKFPKGERKIRDYLIDHGYEFETQKTFEGLTGLKNGLLSYDFYVRHKNLLIEYQGNYHDGTAKNQSENDYLTQQEHDRRKRNYAKRHNINLLEVWYRDFNRIDEILDEYLGNQRVA